MMTRIALYLALGLTLTALGATITGWEFWCTVGLFWASERLAKQEQHEQSYVEVILMFIALDSQAQQELVKAIKQVEQQHND